MKLRVVRLTFSSRYYKPGMHANLERAILNQLRAYGSLNAALAAGWLQEMRPTRGPQSARRFVIYLTDKTFYHDIPVYFSLAIDGKVL